MEIWNLKGHARLIQEAVKQSKKTPKAFSLFLFPPFVVVCCWFVVTATDYKLCESVIPALSIPQALFLFQLTLVALRVRRIVGKTGYLNPVNLPGGDSQHLYNDTCHLALSARFAAEASVGWRGCESLQSNQNLCEITADGFILGTNRRGSRSRK